MYIHPKDVSKRFDLEIDFESPEEKKRLITALYLAYRQLKSEETRQLVSQVLNELESKDS
jgi:subtilisin-like proprotein convertase family protein